MLTSPVLPPWAQFATWGFFYGLRSFSPQSRPCIARGLCVRCLPGSAQNAPPPTNHHRLGQSFATMNRIRTLYFEYPRQFWMDHADPHWVWYAAGILGLLATLGYAALHKYLANARLNTPPVVQG